MKSTKSKGNSRGSVPLTLRKISWKCPFNVNPVQGGLLTGRQTAIFLIAFNWLWSLVFAIPPLIGWGLFLPESSGLR